MCKQTCNTAAALAACQRDLADKDAQLSVAIEANCSLSRQIAEQGFAADRAKIEIASLKTDLNKVRGWREKDNEVNSKLVERIQLAERRESNLLAQVGELNEALEKASTAHASDRIELVARRDECVKLNDRVVELEGQLAEQGERVSGQIAELQELRGELVYLRRQLNDMTESRDRVKGQRDVARQQCAEKEGECRALRDHSTKQAEKLGGYLTELEGLRRVIANSNDATALIDASREIERLEAIIADLSRQLNDKATDLGAGLEKPVRGLVKAVRAILLNLPMSNGAIGLIEALAAAEGALPKQAEPDSRVSTPVHGGPSRPLGNDW